ncbi:SHOCT domain-containing protein [Cytobacillus kochii]|uniref:SHOCT domain-containing protein n=1 Tax=Cytobacillus kochii TaxID=859143 RepID=UPI00402A8F39
MSFWKKVLGQEDLSPEELSKREEEQAQKKAQRDAQAKVIRAEADRKREERRLEKEKRKEAEKQSMERFLGTNPGFFRKSSYSLNKETFQYVENHILEIDEKVLAIIEAEYDKTSKREIKGILFALEDRLLFAFVRGANQYFEEFDYAKMKGISLHKDGLSSKELYIDYNRSRKKFDDIIDDEHFKFFLHAVNKKIIEYRGHKATKRSKTTTKQTHVNANENKYEQLEKIASLKEKGILNDEEFRREKEKILNN